MISRRQAVKVNACQLMISYQQASGERAHSSSDSLHDLSFQDWSFEDHNHVQAPLEREGLHPHDSRKIGGGGGGGGMGKEGGLRRGGMGGDGGGGGVERERERERAREK